MNRNRKLGFCYPGYRYCGPGCSGPGTPTKQWMLAVNCMMNAMNATVAQNTVMNCFNNASVPI